MASTARIDDIKKKFDENPRRYFAPLANEFRKMGDLEQAILICEEFLPQQPGHMSGHIVYGQTLYESGRLDESRTVFETALGLDPENLIALRHLGDIARSQGDSAAARRWYERVLEADPRNEEIQGLLSAVDAPAAPTLGMQAPTLAEEPTLVMPAPPAIPAMPSPAAPEIETAMDIGPLDLSFTSAPPPAALPPDVPAAELSLEGLEPTSAQGHAPAPAGRAEGLELAEFEAPTAPPPRAEGLEPMEFERPAAGSTEHTLIDLESSFAAETGQGTAPVAPVAGLESASHDATAGLPMLDVDEGTAEPPHGDKLGLGALAPDMELVAEPASPAADPRMQPPAAMEAMPALQLTDDVEPARPAPPADEALEKTLAMEAVPRPAAPAPAPAPAAASDALEMLELTPSVIAAESVLMDAPAEAPVAAGTPFVTETMAELYLRQGFRDKALDVYRQLSAASPGDERLRARIAELAEPLAPPAPAAASGPNVREFFARLAARRPGEQGVAALPPSADDFGQLESAPAPEPVVATQVMEAPQPASPPRAPAPSPAPRAAAAAGGKPSGTIDALFGNQPVGTVEDSAASALAQAFGGAADDPILVGRPARAASGELSLDSVFREGGAKPPRVSQSFSFDQFFSETATTPETSATTEISAVRKPAERSADDIEQFNSWLQGLKQR